MPEEAGDGLRERHSEAEELLAEAEHLLASIHAADPQQSRLQHSGNTLRQASRETLSVLAFEAGLLVPSVQLEAISNGPARLETAQQQADQAFVAMAATIDAGQDTLAHTLDALMQAEATVRAGTEAAHAQLAQAVDGVLRLMEGRQQDALGRIHEIVQAFVGLRADLEKTLDQAGETVCRSQSEEALENTRAHAVDVEHGLVSALQEVEHTVHRVGEEMAQTTEATAANRESMDTLVQDLRARLEPMKRAIESVKEAADEVGLSF